jgi:hypothetical protein
MEYAVVFFILAAFLLPVTLLFGVAIVGPRLSPRVRERFMTFAVSPWRPLLAGVVMLTLFTTINVMVSSGSVLRAMLGSLPMAMMFASFGVFGQMSKRTGSTKRCAKCEYDLSGVIDESPADSQARCPECGSQWSKPGGTVVGDKRWSRLGVAFACLLLLPLLASLTLPFIVGFQSLSGPLMKIMPTGSLIKHVTSVRGFRMDEWAELRKRTLTDDQRETLVRGLLTRDALQLHAWGDEAKWIVAEFATGTLTAETKSAVLERFLGVKWLSPAEVARTQSLAPASGQPAIAEWHIVADGAWGLGGCFTGGSCFLVVSDIVGVSGTVLLPASQTEIPVDLATRSQPPAKSTWTSSSPLDQSLRVRTQGTLRATVWIIVEPRARGPQPVVWNNGTPATAADAIVARVELGPDRK